MRKTLGPSCRMTSARCQCFGAIGAPGGQRFDDRPVLRIGALGLLLVEEDRKPQVPVVKLRALVHFDKERIARHMHDGFVEHAIQPVELGARNLLQAVHPRDQFTQLLDILGRAALGRQPCAETLDRDAGLEDEAGIGRIGGFDDPAALHAG